MPVFASKVMVMFMKILLYLLISLFQLSQVFSDSKSSDDFVPCDRGWYYFRGNCYRIFGARKSNERLPWSAALGRCKNYGGDLVSIHSQEEQDFVVAFLLLDVKWWTWIGLNDRDKEGDFKWSDGSVFNYSNWQPTQPSGVDYLNSDEDCVHFLFEPDKNGGMLVGEWNDRPCESQSTQAYICEKKSNPRKRSPNLIYCTLEEGGGWKYETSCYHIVEEKMSWLNAERHCKNNYNGYLLTINDAMEDYFLELGIPDIRREMWIGIKSQNQAQQKWTSGWYVSYDGFGKEEKTFMVDTCIARKKRQEWVTIPCSTKLPFICEVSKVRPPVLEMPPVGAHCPTELDDWRDLGGEYCYYFETSEDSTFYEARFDCARRGGDLVSLHSQEESDILQPFIAYKKISVYIGLVRLWAYNEETFGWLDGSTLDYQNWRNGEPNSIAEKCAQAYTNTMEWNDISCDEKSGYICSVKKVVTKSSFIEETSDCASFCIAPSSYLFGLLNQCPDAKRIA